MLECACECVIKCLSIQSNPSLSHTPSIAHVLDTAAVRNDSCAMLSMEQVHDPAQIGDSESCFIMIFTTTELP